MFSEPRVQRPKYEVQKFCVPLPLDGYAHHEKPAGEARAMRCSPFLADLGWMEDHDQGMGIFGQGLCDTKNEVHKF